MKRQILIFPEFGLRHIFWLLKGFNAIENPDVEVLWTHKKWYPPSMGPIEDTDYVKCMPYDAALMKLAEGGFDAVVFSDGTSMGYMTNGISSKTKRVYLDSSDSPHVVGSALYFADYYLKCQYPDNDLLMVGDSYGMKPYSGSVPVIPWPYCTSSWIEDSWIDTPPYHVSARVFFHGWCYPPKRVDTVKALIDAGVPFHGGFYGRKELPVPYQKVPEEIEADRLSFPAFVSELRGSQIALNTIGNGQMCFRTHEIFRSGVCMVSQPINVKWIGRPPTAGEEWFPCEDDREIVEICKRLIDMPDKCREVGEAGRRYWDEFCHPKISAMRLLNVLGWDNL